MLDFGQPQCKAENGMVDSCATLLSNVAEKHALLPEIGLMQNKIPIPKIVYDIYMMTFFSVTLNA